VNEKGDRPDNNAQQDSERVYTYGSGQQQKAIKVECLEKLSTISTTEGPNLSENKEHKKGIFSRLLMPCFTRKNTLLPHKHSVTTPFREPRKLSKVRYASTTEHTGLVIIKKRDKSAVTKLKAFSPVNKFEYQHRN
jgi:hypothetical protein